MPDTTQADIRKWFLRGLEEGATHMIVACDTFEWEDYPVYVQPGELVREEVTKYDGKNMQKVMEVYNLALPIEDQINLPRAWKL